MILFWEVFLFELLHFSIGKIKFSYQNSNYMIIWLIIIIYSHKYNIIMIIYSTQGYDLRVVILALYFVVTYYIIILYRSRHWPFQQMSLYRYIYIACLITVFVCCLMVKVLKNCHVYPHKYTSDDCKDRTNV